MPEAPAIRDVPTSRMHFLFFYTQNGGSGFNVFDDQVVDGTGGGLYGSIFSSRTGFAGASGDTVCGNFRIRLSLGSGYQTWPVFNVTLDHYSTGTGGGFQCSYTEPVVFDFPCTVTTNGAAATNSTPAIAPCTVAFTFRVVIANHPIPLLSQYASHASIAVLGNQGSVPPSTTAGHRKRIVYETYSKITNGTADGQAEVANAHGFEGYPGCGYSDGYVRYTRPGIFTGLSTSAQGPLGTQIQIPNSTFVLERYGLPGTLVAIDPGRAAANAGESPFQLIVHSAPASRASGEYHPMDGLFTRVDSSGDSRTAYRLACTGGTWGLYGTALAPEAYMPPAGVDGWQLLATAAAPEGQTQPPHQGWNAAGMAISGMPDRIASPRAVSAKLPAPSYSRVGMSGGHPFYEANLPIPATPFQGHSTPQFPGDTQAFWRYLAYAEDVSGYVLCDTVPPPSQPRCPADSDEYPCALPIAPPSIERYGSEYVRDVALKINNVAVNINRPPSQFRNLAVIGRGGEALMNLSSPGTFADAMVAGGVWGYYPLARQLRIPTGTQGDPSYGICLKLRTVRTSESSCSVNFVENCHYCDLDHEHESSYQSVHVSGNFVPSPSGSYSMFGACGIFEAMIQDAGLATYSMWDNDGTMSGNLVSLDDYSPGASGATQSYSFESVFRFEGPATCVVRNGDMVDSLVGVRVSPIAFEITHGRSASLTISQRTVDPATGEGFITVEFPYSATLSHHTVGGNLWEDGGTSGAYPFAGPNRVGGAAAIQLVSGYSDRSPHAADSDTESAVPFCGDLHRVYATASAYAIHQGLVPGSGNASFKRYNPTGGGYATVSRSFSPSYRHSGVSHLYCDEPCLVPRDFSGFPVTPKTARKANDLFVLLCSKMYSGSGPGSYSYFYDRKLSYCRIEISRTADMKSSIMGSTNLNCMEGTATTTVQHVEWRDCQPTTIRYEKFHDPDGSKFEELVEEYEDYRPANWSTASFPEPPIANWVDPNLPYAPAAMDLTYVSKRTGVVAYLRRDRTETTLNQEE